MDLTAKTSEHKKEENALRQRAVVRFFIFVTDDGNDIVNHDDGDGTVSQFREHMPPIAYSPPKVAAQRNMLSQVSWEMTFFWGKSGSDIMVANAERAIFIAAYAFKDTLINLDPFISTQN